MMQTVCLVGLDEPEARDIQARLSVPSVAHAILPRMLVKDGQLYVEGASSARMLPANKVVFHGIFDDDLDFITGLALWGGACLPRARGMMDARLKFACLVKALELTRFGFPRGYVSPWAHFDSESEQVAKWGNWHCGENKARFSGSWSSENPAIIEPFIAGEAVRVVIIGEQAWQIRLEGDDWLKSIHHAQADFMDLDPDLLADTQTIQAGFGLEVIANDYLVTPDGKKYLLEVNHIPNVTRFPEIWVAYRDLVVEWIHAEN